MDTVSKETRSETMRRIHATDTTLEGMVRSGLFRRRLRYRLSSTLPGKPDIVFPGARVAVFVDSCFWHGCPVHCRFPATNREYWDAKIQRNRRRDEAVTTRITAEGWRVLRIWEHSIREHFDDVLSDIEEAVRKPRG